MLSVLTVIICAIFLNTDVRDPDIGRRPLCGTPPGYFEYLTNDYVTIKCDNGGHFENREHRLALINNTSGAEGWVAKALSPNSEFRRSNEICLDQFPVDAVDAWWRATHAETIFDKPLSVSEAKGVVVLADYFDTGWLRDKCDEIVAESMVESAARCRLEGVSFSCLFSKDSGAAGLGYFRECLCIWRLANRCSLPISKLTAVHVVCDFFRCMTQAPSVDDVRDLLFLFVEADSAYSNFRSEGKALGSLTDEDRQWLQTTLTERSEDVWDAIRCFNMGVDNGRYVSKYSCKVQLAMQEMMEAKVVSPRLSRYFDGP